MKLIEIVDSDQKILQHTKRDGKFFVFEHDELPQPLRGQVPDNITRDVLNQWVIFIREHYNEIEKRKNYPPQSTPVPVPDALSQADPAANDSGGGRAPDQVGGAGLEASVEEYLRAKIAAWEARKDRAEAACEAAYRAHYEANAEVERICSELSVLRAQLEAVLNASPDGRTTGHADTHAEVQAGHVPRKAGRVARRKVPQPKPTGLGADTENPSGT